MDEKIQETINQLKALALDGDSNENLSSICSVLYKPEFGWTIGACSMLREILIDTLEMADPTDWADGYLDEVGLMRLPVDADGVPIHVGDKLDGYGKTIEVVELRISHNGWVIVGRNGNAYADAYADTCAFTHHHAQTIEDVLREYGDEVRACCDTEDTITEYAARLREVMVDE